MPAMASGAIFVSVLIWSFFFQLSAGLTVDNPPAGTIYALVPNLHPGVQRGALHRNASMPAPLNTSYQDPTSGLPAHPEQILVTPANRGFSSYWVSWVVPYLVEGQSQYAISFIYGLSPTTLSSQAICYGPYRYTYLYGASLPEYVSGYHHHCLLKTLKKGQDIYYKIGGDSSIRSFQTVGALNELTDPVLIVGNMDITQDSANKLLEYGSIFSSAHLTIVLGDLSYADKYNAKGCKPFTGASEPNDTDVCAVGGAAWDTWGRLNEEYFSRHAMLFLPGERELEVNPQFGETVPRKVYRFRIPQLTDDSASFTGVNPASLPSKGTYPPQSQEYYSIDVGYIHFIFFSHFSPWTIYTSQYNWLRDDLCSVNRTKTPFVVFLTHVPWYSSNTQHYAEGEAARLTFEQWLYEAAVDFVVAAHADVYERTKRIYAGKEDPCGIFHITMGNLPNSDVQQPFIAPSPSYVGAKSYTTGPGYFFSGPGPFVEPNATASLIWHWNPVYPLDDEPYRQDDAFSAAPNDRASCAWPYNTKPAFCTA